MSGAQSFGPCALYVGDLARDVSETNLFEVFSKIGPVASIRVCRDIGTKKSLGYAYVNFHNPNDAQRCIDTLNYATIKGVPCRIMWSHRDPALRKAGTGNIFVKNLDKVIDTKALHDTFSIFGNILSCKVARDEFGKSKGFGFVHYENEHSAKLAIERVNGMSIGNKQVVVCPFQKNEDRANVRPQLFTNLYVKHIPDAWDEALINSIFSEFGTIQSMVVQKDGRNRRFVLVNFETPASAAKAIEELHGRKTSNTGVEPKDDMYHCISAMGCMKTSESAGSMEMKGDDKEDAAQDQSSEAKKTDLAADPKLASSEGAAPQQPASIDPKAGEQSVSDPDKLKTFTSEAPAEPKPETPSPADPAVESAASKSSVTEEANDVIISDAEPDKERSTEESLAPETTSQSAKEEPQAKNDSQPDSAPRLEHSDDLPEDRLHVQRAMTKAERISLLKNTFGSGSGREQKVSAMNLYVKNLDDKVTDEILREAFAKFGTVLSARVMCDDKGVSRGFGFVNFAFPEEATKAVSAMHLRVFQGKALYVGLAEKRDYRSARLQQRFRTTGAPAQLGGLVMPRPMRSYGPQTGVLMGAGNLPQSGGTLSPSMAVHPAQQMHSGLMSAQQQLNGSGPAGPLAQQLMYSSTPGAGLSHMSPSTGQNPPPSLFYAAPGQQPAPSAGPPFNAANAAAGLPPPTYAPAATLMSNWRRGSTTTSSAQQQPAPSQQQQHSFSYASTAPPPPQQGYSQPNDPVAMMQPGTTQLGMRQTASSAAAQGGALPNAAPGQHPNLTPNQRMRRTPPVVHSNAAVVAAAQMNALRPRLGTQQQQQQQPGYTRVPAPPGSQQPPPHEFNPRDFAMSRPMQPMHPTSSSTMQQPQPFPQSSVDPLKLSPMTLNEVHPQMRKQLLGERLFPLVHNHHPELAGKITGMMLEMDTYELLSLIESESLLTAKVEEALRVLRRHHMGTLPTQTPASQPASELSSQQ